MTYLLLTVRDFKIPELQLASIILRVAAISSPNLFLKEIRIYTRKCTQLFNCKLLCVFQISVEFFAFIFIQLKGVYFLCSETNGPILKTLMRPETEDNALNLFKNDKKKYKFIRIFMY